MSNLENLRKLHKPVLVSEVLEAFGVGKESLALSNKRLKIIDATLGVGGHTEELVKRGVEVLGIDQDRQMLEAAGKRLSLACPTPEKNFQGSYKLVKGNFKSIKEIAEDNDFTQVDGVLLDLGVSSPQLTSNVRGLSFQDDFAPLDMRLDVDEMALTGSDLLNVLREDQLEEMFSRVLNPKLSRDLTYQIVNFRKYKRIETVGDFKKVINKVIFKKGKKSPETLPFLALRIAVNSEIENIKEGLEGALKIINNNGRIVVISFHSGEDNVVKGIFEKFETEGQGRNINKKPIKPSEEEVVRNVRSRSALLRIFEKYEQKKSDH